MHVCDVCVRGADSAAPRDSGRRDWPVGDACHVQMGMFEQGASGSGRRLHRFNLFLFGLFGGLLVCFNIALF